MMNGISNVNDAPKCRIVEVKQHGRTWYEVQRLVSKYIRGPQPDWRHEWEMVGEQYATLEIAQYWRDYQVNTVRVERVIE